MEDGKVKVTFDETRVVDDASKGTAAEIRFEAGKTYELSLRSADRWVKRGVAHFETDEDAARAAGASSDVALRMQDSDRSDPNAKREVPVGTATDGKPGADGDDTAVDYEGMKVEDLKALAEKRGVAVSGNKSAIIKTLERDDAVNTAIKGRDFDALHVDELREYAEKEQIDLTGKSSKGDIVEAVSAHQKPAAT